MWCCAQCGKVGAWERAKSIIVDMRADGIAPTVFTYSSLINAYSKVGKRNSVLVHVLAEGSGHLYGFHVLVGAFFCFRELCKKHSKEHVIVCFAPQKALKVFM